MADNEDDPYTTVADMIKIHSDLTREQPETDFLSIDLIGRCGHVGSGGNLRDLFRDGDLPVEEWFKLRRWRNDPYTAGILFTCRTEDFERVSEADLNVARAMDAYARANNELPWELIFITKNGSFAASDLLRLEGLPVFWEPCNLDI